MQTTPRRGRCRIRIFVPDAEGELLGDRAVVVCSEMEGNPGAGVTEDAEGIMWNIKASGQNRTANFREYW